MALGYLHPSCSFPWAQSPGMCPNSTLPHKNWGKRQLQVSSSKPRSSSPPAELLLLCDDPEKSLLIPALPHPGWQGRVVGGMFPIPSASAPTPGGPWGHHCHPVPSQRMASMVGKPFLASTGIF